MSALFQKIIAFFMSILAFFGINFGFQHVEKDSYKIDDNMLIIMLDENPTTGYNWTYEIDGNAITFVSKDYKSDITAPLMVGGGGTAIFTFEAVKEGRAEIEFEYERNWEENSEIEECKLILTVDKNLNITVESFVLETIK